MSFEAEMVSIPRAELDAMMAELGRLRREVARGKTEATARSDRDPADSTPVLAREALAKAWGITD